MTPRILAAALVLAVAPALPASASGAAACVASGTAGGSSFDLVVDCAGRNTDPGSYVLTIIGVELCGASTGTGTLTGTGPHGALSGWVAWRSAGTRYAVAGTYVSGGHGHDLQLALDVAGLCGGAVAGVGALTSVQVTEGEPEIHCGFDTYSLGGDSDHFAGMAYGVVVDPYGGDVTFRCYIEVNGADVASTPTTSGVGATATAGPVEFDLSELDEVRLCGEAVTARGTSIRCWGPTETSFPTPEQQRLLARVAGLADEVLTDVVWP